MNKRLVCALLCLGLTGWISIVGNVSAEDAANASAAAKKPTIKFEEPQFNFGTIRQGDKVDHEFKFKNAGTDILKITNVSTSCGCTAAGPSSQEIPPGGEGTIKVTFNSGNFLGQITKNVFVNSNDPDQPQARLGLVGAIETDVTATPAQVFFGMIEQGQPATRVLNVKQGGQKELNVTNVETNLAFVTAKLIPESAGKVKSYNVELTLNPDAPVGKFDGKLKVYTNLPGFEVIERPVVGIIKPKADAAANTPEKK